MKEQLVTFEIAKELEKLGFNIPCDWSINEKNETHFLVFEFYPNNSEFTFNPEDDPEVIEYEKFLKTLKRAPTQSLAQQWLRETHDIYVEVCSFKYKIKELNTIPRKFWFNVDGTYSKESYGSWEGALEKGLEEGLSKVKI